MIGFKKIEEFTFDECVKYLDSHQDGDEYFHEILNRYNTLSNKIQRNDDGIFKNCCSERDYEKYLSLYSASEYTQELLDWESSNI